MPTPSDPESLAANRRGQVTPEQNTAVAQQRFKTTVRSAGLLISLIVFGLVILGNSNLKLQNLGGGVFIVLGLSLVLAPILIALAWSFIRTRRVQAESGEEQVEQAEGEVVWKEGNFVAEIQGQRLRPIYGETLNLPPGRYRFFYLPHRGELLSGEPLSSRDASAATPSLLEALAQANEFKVEALQANREGRFADSQTSWLRVSIAWYSIGGMAAAGLMVWLSVLNAASPQPFSQVFILILAVPFIFFFFWHIFRIAADLRAGKVAAVEGYVHKTISRRRRSTHYYYRIEGLRFLVSYPAYNALIEGIPYRVYYTPRSKQLVAIEPIS